MARQVAVINAGSSSIKFALFDATEPMPREASWRGKVEGIASDGPTFAESGTATRGIALDAQQPYHAALALIREHVRVRLGDTPLAAVAHRVVHGGSKYFAPVRVDANVLADLRSYIPLAPLHQPFALEAIDEFLRSHPDLPQVACFDTAFHATLPDIEKLLPLPYDAWQRGLRRYGFHGLSYEYLSIALAERNGERARGRTICAHLGSGASLCGMRNLQSAATTMGFSALDGLMMGTRCGDLDPGAVFFLARKESSLATAKVVLNEKAGLLGVSEISSDVEDLLDKQTTDPRAAEAIDLFCYQAKKFLGSMIAVLGGLDKLVFTAGIGEHAPAVRSRICEGLEFLGIRVDAKLNNASAAVISTEGSRVQVRVMKTNEEIMIARYTNELLSKGASPIVR